MGTVEDDNSIDAYEEVDDDKMEKAAHMIPETDDNHYEDLVPGELFGRSSSKDEEEAYYVNVTTEYSMHFIDMYGEGTSGYKSADNEQYIDIYGEEDFIYQNTGPVWSETKHSANWRCYTGNIKCFPPHMDIYLRYLNSL